MTSLAASHQLPGFRMLPDLLAPAAAAHYAHPAAQNVYPIENKICIRDSF
jgi:hypothetical protein